MVRPITIEDRGGYKKCSDCKVVKPVAEFYRSRNRNDGLHSICKSCSHKRTTDFKRRHPKRAAAYQANSRKRNLAKWRRNHRKYFLLKTYGVSEEEYLELKAAGGGRCMICGKSELDNGKSLCVDHNHNTGQVRGILCVDCNNALGRFQTDSKGTALLERAIEYIGRGDSGLVGAET